jgi:hypothetical protein
MVAASALIASGGYAQETPEIETLDVTMELMAEGATLPEAVTRVIELPEAAAEAARLNAAGGLERANEARGNAAQGLEIAAEARERAQESRENAGRGGPPDFVEDIPIGPPADLPGPPEEMPGSPEEPAGPPGN